MDIFKLFFIRNKRYKSTLKSLILYNYYLDQFTLMNEKLTEENKTWHTNMNYYLDQFIIMTPEKDTMGSLF